ncbi:MogA/MoaB family molybdenum cofactor biosynthesis protein [Candidatus Halobonum tyrrellensis]|uniref:MogA/MoaB family molybdenum cofactor biosynthesis protein n=1 Tax=Candidatus Halobonum tyrrellensis TaxID=1431545 RepID=UPI000678148E|nr:MogA/MoaB family molybdenum cofactor biosynthesis protein [Candidatus Halobonum tyrrellensis]
MSDHQTAGDGADGDGTDDHDHSDGNGDADDRDHPDGNDHPDGHGHEHHAHDLETLGYAIVTVSSSRSIDDDPAGDAVREAVESVGDRMVTREVVTDDYDGVQQAVNNLVTRDDVDCVVTAGGTGVTPDDVTVEAVEPLFEKRLPGFGELFRSLSREEVGTAVVATRATAGVANRVPVFCLPGSENAVRLGAEEIITEQAAHLAGLAKRGEGDDEDDEE